MRAAGTSVGGEASAEAEITAVTRGTEAAGGGGIAPDVAPTAHWSGPLPERKSQRPCSLSVVHAAGPLFCMRSGDDGGGEAEAERLGSGRKVAAGGATARDISHMIH